MIQSPNGAPAVVRATSLGHSIRVEPITCTIGAELGNVNLGAAAEDDGLMAQFAVVDPKTHKLPKGYTYSPKGGPAARARHL